MKIIFSKWKQRRAFRLAQRQLNGRIAAAVDEWIIRKGFTKNLPTVELIADDIGVPPDWLSTYIRVHKRKCVLCWRKELRIREARRLLREFPHLPVATVGEMVGVDDKSNFKRQFREVTGMTPRAWRERHLR